MLHISILNGLGSLYKNRECFVVGGGTSVNGFKFPENAIIINANLPKHGNQVHLMVYADECIDKSLTGEENYISVGQQVKELNYTPKKANYIFTRQDIPHVDSGYHALFIASNILKFEKISLIGIDYYADGENVHYYDDPVSYKKRYESSLFKNVDKWQRDDFICRDIINYSEKSKLKVFPKV